jgi:hypothetical protein
MAQQDLASGEDPLPDRLLPAGSGRGHPEFGNGVVDLPGDDLDDPVQDLFLAGDVVVEGHRFGPEFLREAAHRERPQAALVGELDRGPQHPLPAQRDPEL